ncbi:hypothetical protein LPB140_07535 [Sphingorhabdus lutea]|uniref:Uncharacterized protein n=1 Tax=Sphingorhabdus lutea TaxID=1913578 RepID=A0A1L3JBZ8_9SPHN|nr:hypothetical protein [Sphingorhabdus lutea]APG62664.1 hypothetical protein LPB140_07535 [Sphingorhabdus lutea]
MNFAGPSFVIAIIAICTAGWIINNWIRAKHGYPLEDEWGGKSEKLGDINHSVELLTNQNNEMKGKISRLEERISVLERIATDTSSRLADEIENLR